MGKRASLWGGGWPHGRARAAFDHDGGTASGPRSSRVSPRPSVGASVPSMPLDLRRPSTPTMGMIANSAFTSRGRSSSGEPPAAAAAGAHLFSGPATASSGVAMSGAAREGRTAERLNGLAGAKPSAAPTASSMAQAGSDELSSTFGEGNSGDPQLVLTRGVAPNQTCNSGTPRSAQMVLSPAMLVLFCAALVGASPGRQLQDESPPPPLWRKLQAKMNIEFCSKNTASELEPCKVSALVLRAACASALRYTALHSKCVPMRPGVAS